VRIVSSGFLAKTSAFDTLNYAVIWYMNLSMHCRG
jgi:hypothetical protein